MRLVIASVSWIFALCSVSMSNQKCFLTIASLTRACTVASGEDRRQIFVPKLQHVIWWTTQHSCCFLTSLTTKVCSTRGLQPVAQCVPTAQLLSNLTHRGAQKARCCCSFWDFLTFTFFMHLVFIYTWLTLMVLRQQWGMRCGRRGQRWHLTPFHFKDNSVPLGLKCQHVQAVLLGVNSRVSQTVFRFVCLFVLYWRVTTERLFPVKRH